LDEMAIAGRRYYDEQLSMQRGVKTIHEMLESIQRHKTLEKR